MKGVKPNYRFRYYKDIFNNLLNTNHVRTDYPICSVIITYDSELAVVVSKKNEKEVYVNMYDLITYC